jgi:histidyl-tRNA synthetase
MLAPLPQSAILEPIRAIKGMNDLLPEEAAAFSRLERVTRELFARYGFGELRTPLLEEAALFTRSMGETTDVVEKEMYVFPDRHGKPLALRPEGTAGAVRAFVEHNQAALDPLTRWFYLGPMFRHERPQKGRYRQFHQVGAELFGASGPQADAELIAMIEDWLRALGVRGVTLQLSSIGDSVCRPAYLERLKHFLAEHREQLGASCQRRIDTNPLRVLDCKDPQCQPVIALAPAPVDYLCEPCRAHFDELLGDLKVLGVDFRLNPRLVRGLDYYNRTTFEFTAEVGLGSQDAVAAGGRYDGLVEQLGGPPTPAVGFAAGVERLLIVQAATGQAAQPRAPDLFIAVQSDAARHAALSLAHRGRAAGLWVDLDLRFGSLKSQLRRADRSQVALAVVLGDEEVRSGRVRLKPMNSERPGLDSASAKAEVSLDSIVDSVVALLGMVPPHKTGDS